MPRVGILGLLHESNTFLPARTTRREFEQDLLCTGEAVRTRLAGSHHEIAGFFAGLAEAGCEAVPIFAARALPFGVIAAADFETLLEQMFHALAAAGPLEGVLVAAHGAMVAEQAADADGYWLTRLRHQLGPNCPIIGTLDLHANLSPAMAAACDALVGYRTNPHLDQRERGLEAARLMARMLQGEIRPVMAARFPPLLINIERQATAEEPCHSLLDLANEQLDYPLVLSNSVLLGFPYADVAEVGCSVIVVTDGDNTIAGNLADDLALALWQRREDFRGRFLEPSEAVRQAAQGAGRSGPVVLLDMGDNIGGGAPGDGTWLAWELAQQRVPRSLVCLADAEAVGTCRAAGLGRTIELTVGGRSPGHGATLLVRGRVIGFQDGRFREPHPTHGGYAQFDQGPTAVFESDTGLTILLTTHRMVPFSLNQLHSAGLAPEGFQVIVAKGVHAPVAAYKSIAAEFLRVNTPGTTCADLRQFRFHHRRRPLFPFETDIDYRPVTTHE